MIRVIEEDTIYDDPNGLGEIKKHVSELVTPYPMKLIEEEKLMAIAYIQILGYPKVPTLPAWHGNR